MNTEGYFELNRKPLCAPWGGVKFEKYLSREKNKEFFKILTMKNTLILRQIIGQFKNYAIFDCLHTGFIIEKGRNVLTQLCFKRVRVSMWNFSECWGALLTKSKDNIYKWLKQKGVSIII